MSLSLPVIVVILLLLLMSSIRVLKEYERGVMFTLGRFTGVKGPGVRLVLPVIQQMRKVELRTIVLNVPKQDVISRDNVSVKVSAVVYFRIVDPEKAILQVVDPWEATSQLAQTTLRSVAGQHEMDEMLAQRDKLNAAIQQILDANTAAWGMKVTNVEIKDIDLDETMIRAMARQAEAERAQTRQSDPRRRREAGRADTGRSRQAPVGRACVVAAALPADACRHLQREELDNRLPVAHRSDRAVAGALETRLLRRFPCQKVPKTPPRR